MPFTKRLFDVTVSASLLIALAPIMFFIVLMILIKDGRPIFYISERMKTTSRSFRLIKFRTMEVVASDTGVSGADKASRITRTGAILRKTRIDEVPQLLNVLRGDMSLVGPRPPLRQYTELFPNLYDEVLSSRPGITGLASLRYHQREEVLLSRCRSPQETHDVYSRFCVPSKAKIDIIYSRNRSICYDIKIIILTVTGKIFTRV